MGRRYKAILGALDEPFACYDVKSGSAPPHPGAFDRFIIATPTSTHLGLVQALDQYGKPILCEKPLSTDLAEVEQILACKSPLQMMAQYTHLLDDESDGLSYYSYYAHGPDGLVWDCFQIIALSNGPVEVHEDSPVWLCAINGLQLSKDDMDQAYVDAVAAWLKGAAIPREQLLAWHKKVKDYEANAVHER